ncbi:heavy-metal-associated domain-containing protein [Nitrospira moscoviensis]|uniref:Mercuric transport protein periplasmic component n=1 Tax=Nitrospira moscoviensis TaxID=42253 RepID=A0A0K2GAJ4_NITMO|nr:heavy-metal-associated domain-containing protein [Nitrospira moscoviensis]ALA57986.1 Mercuric transport protein periplasmic component [Nitrospira moscoviensis]
MWQVIRIGLLVGVMMLALTEFHSLSAENQGVQTVTMQIDGMTCGACVKDVKAALAKVPGVSAVEVRLGKKWIFFSDYSDARASVTFDPEKVGMEALIKAIEGAGSPLSPYKARLLQK